MEHGSLASSIRRHVSAENPIRPRTPPNDHDAAPRHQRPRASTSVLPGLHRRRTRTPTESHEPSQPAKFPGQLELPLVMDVPTRPRVASPSRIRHGVGQTPRRPKPLPTNGTAQSAALVGRILAPLMGQRRLPRPHALLGRRIP